MKLAWKIFIITYVVVILITSGGIALLIKFISDEDFNNLKENALSANNFAVRTFLTLENKNIGEIDEENLENISNRVFAILESKKVEKIDIIKDGDSIPLHQKYYIKKRKNYKSVIVTEYGVNIDDNTYTIITETDISTFLKTRQTLWKYYRIIITVVSAVSGVLLFFITRKISKPIQNLSNAVSEITNGKYGMQIDESKSSIEISELTSNFNIMSLSIKESTDALKNETEKQNVFIRNFTHEIKTPMTSIIGYADLLRRYNLDEKEKSEATEFIYNESRRLERLSITLTELFLLNENKINFEIINLKKLYDKISKYLEITADKYNVNLSIRFDDKNIIANETLLISLINNLAENALKASEVNGLVEIFTEIKSNKLIFHIKDNGIGISKDNIKRIKEPFYMVDKSRSRKSGGSGLGLSLCDTIAKLHNTELCFISQENIGTTVSFELSMEDFE